MVKYWPGVVKYGQVLVKNDQIYSSLAKYWPSMSIMANYGHVLTSIGEEWSSKAKYWPSMIKYGQVLEIMAKY